jgi:hypothetical protein
MADNTQWEEDCLDHAQEAGHALGGPVAGTGAEIATLAAAFAESAVPPAAIPTALAALGAYETGSHVFGPAVGEVISGVDYLGCATDHYIGEGIHYISNEAQQAAVQTLIDHMTEPSHAPVELAPAWSPELVSAPDGNGFHEAGFTALDVGEAGTVIAADDAHHAAHTVLESFEPSSIDSGSDNSVAAIWSDSITAGNDSVADSHSSFLSSLFSSSDSTPSDSPPPSHESSFSSFDSSSGSGSLSSFFDNTSFSSHDDSSSFGSGSSSSDHHDGGTSSVGSDI